MTGAELKRLRESNGLSERQMGRLLGFPERDDGRRSVARGRPKVMRNIAKDVRKIENSQFVPEPFVNVINEMIGNGKLRSD